MRSLTLSSLQGRPVVLYFYPKDDTSGCTTEACEFRDLFPRFDQGKAVILGVSPDPVKSHAKFKAKYELPFTLLADTEKAIAQAYDVWKEKSMYGRKYMGVERTTFVIDAKGKRCQGLREGEARRPRRRGHGRTRGPLSRARRSALARSPLTPRPFRCSTLGQLASLATGRSPAGTTGSRLMTADAPAALKRTPLHDVHVALGAKIVPFAGFEMPVQYPQGITAEHKAVRESCGMFDVSHMGEVIVRGPDAIRFVSSVTSNDVAALAVGQIQYSTLLRADGTIVDDLLVYRYADHLMLVINASNRDKDIAHLTAQLGRLRLHPDRRRATTSRCSRSRAPRRRPSCSRSPTRRSMA